MVRNQFDQANAQRLFRTEQVAGVKDALRLPRPDKIDEQLGVVQRIDEAELGGRDPEACRERRYSNIAGERHAAAAADAIAVDERHRRSIGARDGKLCGVDRGLIGGAPLGVICMGREFADIRSRAEHARARRR